jgi:hypothetical protein
MLPQFGFHMEQMPTFPPLRWELREIQSADRGRKYALRIFHASEQVTRIDICLLCSRFGIKDRRPIDPVCA